MSEFPAKKNAAHTFSLGLPSIASSGVFQVNPTLATGDVQISKDGGALANLASLPTVTPAGGKIVQVVLTATEMNADNVTLVFSDQADDEWQDVLFNVQTSSVQLNELATQASVDTVDGLVDAIKAKTDDLTFTKTNELDTNIQSVNGTSVTGDGQTGTEWGP